MTMTRVGRAIGLMLAGPLLVALHLALLALDAPPGVIIPVAVVAWLGGPVLVVIGAAMLWSRGRWTFLPSTQPGRLTLWLVVAFTAFFCVFFLGLALDVGRDDPEEFFDNLYLAIPLSLAGACAVGGGVLAAYTLLLRHERSVLVVGTLVLGALVAVFTAGEIGGHEEPNRSDGRRAPTPAPPSSPVPTRSTQQTPAATPAPNSHSNVTVVSVAPGQVQVSFDYAYNQDPEDAAIIAITVSPLGGNRLPLTGYEPVARPIGRGSGHMEVTLTFAQDQLALVQGFSICFTAPGQPDLGCYMTGFGPG